MDNKPGGPRLAWLITPVKGFIAGHGIRSLNLSEA
jgi:hypothetical protein